MGLSWKSRKASTTRNSVWLLDEPNVALDAASLDALRVLIAKHRESGGAVVASTHADLGLADASTLDVSQFSPNRQPEG